MGRKVHSEVQLSFSLLYQLLTHPLCPDSKTLFQSRIGRVNSVYSNICPPKLSCEIHKPPQLWGLHICLQHTKRVFCLCDRDQLEHKTIHGVQVPMVPGHLGTLLPLACCGGRGGFFFSRAWCSSIWWRSKVLLGAWFCFISKHCC